jgi:ADP-heptose:LPS heptosyltransferase
LIVYDPQSRIPVSRYFFDQTLSLICDRPGMSAALEDCGRLPFLKKQGRASGAFEEAQRVPRRQAFTAVHPGSGSEKKCWPLENFLAIIAMLHQKKIEGFLVTGDAEARMDKEIQSSTLPPGWAWLRRPPLLRLAGLLQEAEFYFGNDSGVTHLAAACGTPGLAVFRKDLEVAWRPYGQIAVLSHEDISAITVDSVWKAVSHRLQKK